MTPYSFLMLLSISGASFCVAFWALSPMRIWKCWQRVIRIHIPCKSTMVRFPAYADDVNEISHSVVFILAFTYVCLYCTCFNSITLSSQLYYIYHLSPFFFSIRLRRIYASYISNNLSRLHKHTPLSGNTFCYSMRVFVCVCACLRIIMYDVFLFNKVISLIWNLDLIIFIFTFLIW